MSYVPNDFICGLKPSPQDINSGMALTVIVLIVAVLPLAARRTWFPALTCRIASWSGPLAIDHAVMTDGIDVEPVRAALARLGLAAPGQLSVGQRRRLVAMLAKAEASHDGMLRDHRHTMLDDSDISSTRHARAFVCGALAALVGHAEIYVSGGAEHQGPDGGGPVAVIVDRSV